MFSLALTFFVITNPIGNSPVILAMIKDFSLKKQKAILLRETVFALILAFFFQFLGQVFLATLKIESSTVSLCGGILLLIVALNMIYPPNTITTQESTPHEPYFVPIATPLLAGPGLLTIIMLYSQREFSVLEISGSILLAWVGVGLTLGLAPYLQKVLGKKGMVALEQLMGLLLSMMSIEMILHGARLFLRNLPNGA